jgi:transcriptional regulator with XRE-family HTH domain
MESNQRRARQVGAALRRIRLDRNIRQYRAAQLAGIKPWKLSSYERRRQLPPAATVDKLLTALACSADEFACYYGPWGNVRLHIVLKL